MEGLFAYLLLSSVGLLPWDEYEERLHAAFLAQPEDEALLELEWASSDQLASARLLWGSLAGRWEAFDMTAFGECLCRVLAGLYPAEPDGLRAYGKKTYALWGLLPQWIADAEPFSVLAYADDPLSWNDEEQSRALYETVFRFYEDSAAAAQHTPKEGK